MSWTGSELGSCATEEFNILNEVIKFKIRSTDGDDFCPKFLTITTVDGYKYKSDKMDDWVDERKGGHLRTAKKTSFRSKINKWKYFNKFPIQFQNI